MASVPVLSAMACSSAVIGLKPNLASFSSCDSSDSAADASERVTGAVYAPCAGAAGLAASGEGDMLTLSKPILPEEAGAAGCGAGAAAYGELPVRASGAAAGATLGTAGAAVLGMWMSLAEGVTVKPATLALLGSILSA